MAEMNQKFNTDDGPVTIQSLLEQNRKQREIIAEQTETIADLVQQLAALKKAVFGPKSEKSEYILDGGEQTRMFDEAEQESSLSMDHLSETTVREHTRKTKRKNEETFSSVKHEEVIHEVEDKTCPVCGSEMEVVGKEHMRDELVYIPEQYILRKHYAEVVKCPQCGTDERMDEELPDIAKCVFKKGIVPEPVIPGSYCSPSLLAHIVYQKYQLALPLYRQEQDFKAKDIPLSRQTLANWLIYAAGKYGKPIYDAMKEDLLKNPCIHADETKVQVLRENDRKATTKSQMWCYCSTKQSGKYNVLFNYTRTRNGDNAVQFLGDYSGYIVCDGFDGYNKVQATRCGCWVHVRRKFVECLPNVKPLPKDSIAAQGIRKIDHICKLAEEIEEEPIEKQLEKRQELLAPVLDDFFAWAENTPTGQTGVSKAINYAINEKLYLRRMLESPCIPAHNNRAENAIRPFTVGRKNWLFCNSPKGAAASAILYSLTYTAYANGLNVRDYLTRVFTTGECILPWNSD